MRSYLTPSIALCSLALWAAACGDDKANTAANSGGAAKTVCVPITDADFPAALEPNSCSGQMLAKYGDAGFQAVNAAIIKMALDTSNTPILGTSFQDKLANATPARQAQFTAHLGAFLESVYGNDATLYPGDAPTMIASHQDLAITMSQYTAFINKIVVPALQSVNVISASDIANCFAPPVLDPAFMKTVVRCK